MASPLCEKAIQDATTHGNAILKFISPNDVGQTGGHQCGYYLPKAVWQMFTPHAPRKGVNYDDVVTVTWPDGRQTSSRLKWYGKGTRAEYRLTRFGKDFPYLTFDNVGDLLVLIPVDHQRFIAYVFDLDEDIEEVRAALGLEAFERWAAYQHGAPVVETEDECIERQIRAMANTLTAFPTGEVFSEETRRILRECLQTFNRLSPDDSLLRCVETEYKLFRVVERQICQPEIARLFRSVDDFLQTASRIMNRRKARAGRALENHVEQLLIDAGIPHKMRPPSVDGKPDVIIPSEEAYNDPRYPRDRLVLIGVKTTCKDRWRQVLNEGRQIRRKHILTIQPGISSNQLEEMHTANVALVVPEKLHKDYPKDRRIELFSLAGFVESVRRTIQQ